MKSFSFLSLSIPLVVLAVASACDTSNAPIVPAGSMDATTSSDGHAVSEASSDGAGAVN